MLFGLLLTMSVISFTCTEPQADFHALDCKYPAFVGGFGSGKTEALVQAAIMDKIQCPSGPVACYEPTYDLVRLILAPRLEEKLTEIGVEYTFNKSENIIHTKHYGDFILRTLDNPARIVGYEAFRSHVDEIDTLRRDHAEEVWNKVVARNRYYTGDGLPNRVSAYTTPEGFQFVYERWEKAPGAGYQYVSAPTYANPFLPSDYVQGLRDTYPGPLVEAYIEGQFVNLTSGIVYTGFDRKTCNTDAEWDEKRREPIHVGMDFNVRNMSGVVHVVRDGIGYAVDEIVGVLDTPTMIDVIRQRYGDISIVIYPDASGGGTNSTDASLSDIVLLKQHFKVDAPKKNPFVKDRVMSMNASFEKRLVKVNVEKCPEYALCLEQQIYTDKGDPDKTAGHDHLPDAGGYFVHRRYPVINRKPMLAKVVGL